MNTRQGTCIFFFFLLLLARNATVRTRGHYGRVAVIGETVSMENIRACRDKLSITADLTQYTTDNAMDDLDDVRRAMGFDRINLFADSYGTRYLPNSRVVVIKDGSHVTESPCIDGLVTAFLAQDKALDTACVDQIHLPPFRGARS